MALGHGDVEGRGVEMLGVRTKRRDQLTANTAGGDSSVRARTALLVCADGALGRCQLHDEAARGVVERT